jgi:hypothetical protein
MLYNTQLIAPVCIVFNIGNARKIIYKSHIVYIYYYNNSYIYKIHISKNRKIVYNRHIIFDYESDDTISFEFNYMSKNAAINILYIKLWGYINKHNKIKLNGKKIDDNDNIYSIIFCMLRDRVKAIST